MSEARNRFSPLVKLCTLLLIELVQSKLQRYDQQVNPHHLHNHVSIMQSQLFNWCLIKSVCRMWPICFEMSMFSFCFAETVKTKTVSWCFSKLQEEDEIPDDETLNQMIARNEDEFELFMVRKSHQVKLLNNRSYRGQADSWHSYIYPQNNYRLSIMLRPLRRLNVIICSGTFGFGSSCSQPDTSSWIVNEYFLSWKQDHSHCVTHSTPLDSFTPHSSVFDML